MDTILVLLLVILALGLLIVANRWRTSHQVEPRADAVEGTAWLRRAQYAVQEGQRVVNFLDQIDDPSDHALPVELDDTTLDTAVARLDSLSSSVSHASSTAPTAMDARVCRSLAVTAKTLADDLRREGNERRRLEAIDSPTGSYSRHRAEFDLAVRDLRNHVELL